MGSTGSALRPTASRTVAGTAPAVRRAAPVGPPLPPMMTTRAAIVRSRGDGCSGSPTQSSQTTRAKGVIRDLMTNRSPARLHQLPREGRTEPPKLAPTMKDPRGARTTAPSLRDPTTRRTTAIRCFFFEKQLEVMAAITLSFQLQQGILVNTNQFLCCEYHPPFLFFA